MSAEIPSIDKLNAAVKIIVSDLASGLTDVVFESVIQHLRDVTAKQAEIRFGLPRQLARLIQLPENLDASKKELTLSSSALHFQLIPYVVTEKTAGRHKKTLSYAWFLKVKMLGHWATASVSNFSLSEEDARGKEVVKRIGQYCSSAVMASIDALSNAQLCSLRGMVVFYRSGQISFPMMEAVYRVLSEEIQKLQLERREALESELLAKQKQLVQEATEEKEEELPALETIQELNEEEHEKEFHE